MEEKLLYLASSLVGRLSRTAKTLDPKSVKSILIVKRDEIGDMIYALEVIRRISTNYSKAKIVVYCKAMNNALVNSLPFKTEIINNASELNKYYDVQVDLRGDWSTLRRALFGGCSWYFERGSIRLNNKLSGGQTHEFVTNREIVRPLIKETWDANDLHRLDIYPEQLTSAKNLVVGIESEQYCVMHCGARDLARRWPAEKFANLAQEIQANYKINTVLVGSEGEKEVIDQVATLAGDATFNLSGKTSLMELAAIIRNASFFIGNESGPLHFAILERTPLVALFSKGVKDVFYPLFPNQHVIHYFKESNHTNQDADNSTIHQITVSEVFERIKTFQT